MEISEHHGPTVDRLGMQCCEASFVLSMMEALEPRSHLDTCFLTPFPLPSISHQVLVTVSP